METLTGIRNGWNSESGLSFRPERTPPPFSVATLPPGGIWYGNGNRSDCIAYHCMRWGGSSDTEELWFCSNCSPKQLSKTYAKLKGEIQSKTIAKKNPAKLAETMPKNQNNLVSLPDWNKWWDSSMDGDDRWRKWWWFHVLEHLFTKRMPIQIQAKPTAQLILRTVTEESKAQDRSFWLSLVH